MDDADQPDRGALGRQLIRHAEAISQVQKDLDQLASEVTDAIADLVIRLETAEAGSQPNGGHDSISAWCWRDLGDEGAEALMGDLTDWVAWIRHRYPLANRVPACWSEHPETVEELTALWLAWNAAYTERDAPLTGPIEWHDRWLPGMLHRLEHGAFALNCSQQHHARPTSAYARSFEQSSPGDNPRPGIEPSRAQPSR